MINDILYNFDNLLDKYSKSADFELNTTSKEIYYKLKIVIFITRLYLINKEGYFILVKSNKWLFESSTLVARYFDNNYWEIGVYYNEIIFYFENEEILFKGE